MVNIKKISVDDNFDLKDEYLAHGIILILLPWSIFLFLGILLVKVLCFFFVENQRGVEGSFSRLRAASYGIFNEEDDNINGIDTETVDEVTTGFIKGMQRVIYEASEEPQLDNVQVHNELDFDNENQIRRRKTS